MAQVRRTPTIITAHTSIFICFRLPDTNSMPSSMMSHIETHHSITSILVLIWKVSSVVAILYCSPVFTEIAIVLIPSKLTLEA